MSAMPGGKAPATTDQEYEEAGCPFTVCAVRSVVWLMPTDVSNWLVVATSRPNALVT